MEQSQAEQLFNQAGTLFKQGAPGDALVLLRKLDNAFPNNPKVLFPMAQCLAKTGGQTEAIQICDRLLALGKNTHAALLKQALLDSTAKSSSSQSTKQHDFVPDGASIKTARVLTASRSLSPVHKWCALATVALVAITIIAYMFIFSKDSTSTGLSPSGVANAQEDDAVSNYEFSEDSDSLATATLPDDDEAFTIPRWLVLLFQFVSLYLTTLGALYLTLKIVKKLPNDDFMDDMKDLSLVSLVCAILCLTCLGIIVAFFILRHLYETTFSDFILFIIMTVIANFVVQFILFFLLAVLLI